MVGPVQWHGPTFSPRSAPGTSLSRTLGVNHMRVLAITQIWPNRLEPLRTPFNVQQFTCLASRCDLSVLAAVAHVPGLRFVPKPYRPDRTARLGDLPARDTFMEATSTRTTMRQLDVPKIGVPLAVPLYLASLAPYRALIREADVLLGTWAYPDGCAAILAARALGKPCVVKVHGSDLNVVAKIPSARAIMKQLLPLAGAMVSVSAALSEELEALGVARSNIHLVANGVRCTASSRRAIRREARRALGVSASAPVVVFVGRLEPQKGVGELLEAIPRVRARHPAATFVLLGDGAWSERVKKEAAASGGALVAPGARPLPEIAQWLAACDVFTLPSWMEGTPNVVLEALASGRPVVASNVGGIPDVVPEGEAGYLVPARDSASLADALARALDRSARGAWNPEGAAARSGRSRGTRARACCSTCCQGG